MKLICIFLAAALAVATAKPYGIKGGYDRDNDRLVQSHIPVNDNLQADRLELGQTRKIGRPAYGGEPTLVEPIGGGYRDREAISHARPIGSIHDHDHGRIIEVVRPVSGGYGQISEVGRPIGGYDGINAARPIREHGQISEVGRPIGGYDGINVARPIREHGHGQISEVGRPIGGGYEDITVARPIGGHDHGSIIVAKPIGGGHGHDHGSVIVARPIGGHNSHLETEELGHGIHQTQQIGGIKGGQHRRVGY